MKTKKIIFCFIWVLLFAGCKQPSSFSQSTSTTQQGLFLHNSQQSTTVLVSPLKDGVSRITKKPFGIKVSPSDSPVQPEKFSGYHTGVDFETFPDEQNVDVPVFAVCSGKLLVARMATGYGGVAVQSCSLNNEPVTIIYGHLKFDSINVPIGKMLSPGQQFAFLGKGFSAETDGERKHLHLGIHKGTTINILGYVQQKYNLIDWINPQELL